jgi:hypothetical protein
MTINLMISLLKKGKNGEDILKILNSIAEDNTIKEPTLDPIQF